MSDPIQKMPSWRYHISGKSVIIQSEEESDALGDGWRETPWPEAEQEPETLPEPIPAAPAPEPTEPFNVDVDLEDEPKKHGKKKTY